MTAAQKTQYRAHSAKAAAMTDAEVLNSFAHYFDANEAAARAYEDEADHRDCWR